MGTEPKIYYTTVDFFGDFDMSESTHSIKMSSLRAKISSFSDARSYCGGAVLDLLADWHNKLFKRIIIEKFHVIDTHLILVLRRLSEVSGDTCAVIVFDKLPRAEIDKDFRDGEPDIVVYQFLERLSGGEVSELPGCLVLELKAPLVYIDITSQTITPDRACIRGEPTELTLLMLVDMYGCGNAFLFNNDLPFSRLHHKWSHLVTLDFAKGVIDSEISTSVVKLFNYNANTGEIVYCTGENPTLTENSTDFVHMSSLRFQSKHCVEQSRPMTLGSYGNVTNVLCDASGYWIVCADTKVHYYHYSHCKVYSIDLHQEVNKPALSDNIISAVCYADSGSDKIISVPSLYMLVGQTLLRLCWIYDAGGLQLSGVHRLNRVLSINSGHSLQENAIEEMHIAVEQTSKLTDTAVLCLASHNAMYIIPLEYPSTVYGLRTVIREARYCVTVSMPKYRSKEPARVRFVAPTSHCDPLTLVHVYRNRTVFTLVAVGSHNRTAKFREMSVMNDDASVWSDVEAQERRRLQTWLSLFPHLLRESAQSQQPAKASLYREGEPLEPFTSIHRHSVLREYLRRQKEANECEGEPGSNFENEKFAFSRDGYFAAVGASTRVLLERLAKGEVSLDELLLRWWKNMTPPAIEEWRGAPLTMQSLIEVLDNLAEGSVAVPCLELSSTTPNASLCAPPQSTVGAVAHTKRGTLTTWLADLDLVTLLPAPPSDANTCLAELGRSVDPILLLDLVRCLSPVLSESEGTDCVGAQQVSDAHVTSALYYGYASNSDVEVNSLSPRRDHLDRNLVTAEIAGDKASDHITALSLDIVLHLLLQMRPGQFMKILHCLLSIEYRHLCLLQGGPEEPASPLRSLTPASVVQNPDKVLPKVKSFRTSFGSAKEGSAILNHHGTHPHHHHALPEHEEDDDIFGLSRAVMQARQQPPAPFAIDINALLHRNRLHGARNVSSTVFDQDDFSDEGSRSDSGSENSDDMYGIFRDVSDEGASERLQHNAARQGPSISTTKDTTTTQYSMQPSLARACLRRAVQPLLSSSCESGTLRTSQKAYVTLLEKCERMAATYLDSCCITKTQLTNGNTPDVQESDDDNDDSERVDTLLRVLLLCHQPVLVAQYLIKLRFYDALVVFCLRLAASATHLLEVAAETENTTVSTHPVARYIQAVGGARTSARFSAKQSNPAVAKWDAFLDALYALDESNLMDTLYCKAAATELTPSAAQVRLVEYIVVLKCTLRCLLSRPDGFKDVVGTVLNLVETRPKAVPLDTMRAWVKAFAVDEAEKSRILVSGVLGK